MDPIETLSTACARLLQRDRNEAARLMRERIPFIPLARDARRYSKLQLVSLFIRDRFTDRYTGRRLVFPGTLRLLSTLLPEEFPYQSSWKYSSCHALYWELYPTLDHIVPIARGGRDEESNWVTTSQMRNSAKASFTLEEIGWQLLSIEDSGWDGLLGFFNEYLKAFPALKAGPGVKEWAGAAVRAA